MIVILSFFQLFGADGWFVKIDFVKQTMFHLALKPARNVNCESIICVPLRISYLVFCVCIFVYCNVLQNA